MAVFRIPCTWDPGLLEALDGLPDVTSLFGMLPSHAAGGGRPSAAVAAIDQTAAAEYIGEVRRKGRSFNYLFNAPCLDAREFTAEWRRDFLEHLDWAVAAGANEVTVAVPYLIEIIRKHAPDVRICVSSYARVNSLRRAQYFQDMGADDLTLDPVSVNRDFKVLEAMSRQLSCSLTLIANGICLHQCPYAEYHSVLMGHSSQTGHPSKGYYEEYPFYNCTLRKLRSPVEMIRAGFIRPDDLDFYENIGIRNFKLTDRTRPTAWIVNTARAYASGKYDGNLLDILNFPHFFLGFLCKAAGMVLTPEFPTIDSRQLDGFLEALQAANCREQDCGACDVCRTYAERAVTVPQSVNAVIDVVAAKLKALLPD